MNHDTDSRPNQNAGSDKTAPADTNHRTRKTGAIYCPRCPNWWTGTRSGHCTACHRSFTSIAAFDKHRSGSHAHGKRHCVDPETAGLVPADREWLGWSLPGTWTGPTEDGAV